MERVSTEEVQMLLKFMSKGYKVPAIIQDTIFEIAKREIEEKERVVLVKRDPDIERGRVQAAYVKIIDGKTIDIHPLMCAGMGADFDGDSCYCNITFYKPWQGIMAKYTCHIEDFHKHVTIKYTHSKKKDNGVIIKYFDVVDEVYADAIDIETGSVEKKRIEKWSIHYNLNMYEIKGLNSKKQVFVSDNHSIVVYDNRDKKIIKATPEEILEDKERYFMIRKANNLEKTNE